VRCDVSSFYWRLRKNKEKNEMENQFAGVDFLSSIPYIKKKWKEKKERLIWLGPLIFFSPTNYRIPR
jgi:hypothetical protein